MISLIPKKIKFQKIFKKKKPTEQKTKQNGTRKITSQLISLNYGQLNLSHLELIRKFLVRLLKKRGSINPKISFTKPLTKKASHSRMGGGVGKIYKWVEYIKPGKIIFELSVYDKKIMKMIIKNLYKLNKKIPIKCFLMTKTFLFKHIKKKPDFNIKTKKI